MAGRHTRARTSGSKVIVGMERRSEELRRCLRDDNLSIIGLHGAIGTGKTTSLKELQRDLSSPGADFSLVIFATMPPSGSMREALQVQIEKCLGPPADELTDQKSRCETTLKQLEKERFLLIVDGIWQEFDLVSAGIPLSPHKKDGSKVILSSRYHKLCRKMGAQRLVRMETLTMEEAWLLFQERVGVEAIRSDREITQLAMTVAGYFHDSPLALVMVGAAMAGNKTAEQWKHAVQALQSQSSVSSGLTERAYLLFKFCCSNLWDARTSQCLLSCSIFPKGHSIRQNALIAFWMEELFVGGYDQGRQIIAYLKDSGLLESCPDEEPYVMMPHQIHDMATRLVRETYVLFSSPQKNKEERSSSDSDGEKQVVGKQKLLASREACCLRISYPISRYGLRRLTVHICRIYRTIKFSISDYLQGRLLVSSHTIQMLRHPQITKSSDLGTREQLGVAVLDPVTTRFHVSRRGNSWYLVCYSGDDEREVGSWNLFSYRQLGDFKENYFGGDDEREVGNWALKCHGGDDEREVGNWALKGHGGDDEKEAEDWELIGHCGGDDEREVGNWGILMGRGGDDEKEAGNLSLIGHGGDDKSEVGSSRLIGRGGDDEREVGSRRSMRYGDIFAHLARAQTQGRRFWLAGRGGMETRLGNFLRRYYSKY